VRSSHGADAPGSERTQSPVGYRDPSLGITQNVEYLLDSVLASTMLSNSEFIIMHNQAASDRDKLAKLLNISAEQMSYITGAKEGSGLIRIGNAIVPFKNEFPKNTELYKLMTTKPSERNSVVPSNL
jgi:hypothetical protein